MHLLLLMLLTFFTTFEGVALAQHVSRENLAELVDQTPRYELAKRFAVFVANGGLAITSSLPFPANLNDNINYTVLLNFLLTQGPQDNEVLLPLIESAFSPHPLPPHFAAWQRQTNKFLRKWLEKFSLKLMQHFIITRNKAASLLLLQKYSKLGLRFLHRTTYSNPSEELPFTCPLLEEILNSIEIHGVQSPSARKMLFALRDECLRLLGTEIADELGKKSTDTLYFHHLATYLANSHSSFRFLAQHHGFDRLFFAGSKLKESIFASALARFQIHIVEKIYYLTPGKPLIFPKKQTSVFHLLCQALAQASSSHSITLEKRAVTLLRFFLTCHSETQSAQHIVQALLMKDPQGATPLRLAAEGGYPLLFKEMRTYLREHQQFSEDQHAPAYQLTTILRDALSKRLRTALVEEKAENPLPKKRLKELFAYLESINRTLVNQETSSLLAYDPKDYATIELIAPLFGKLSKVIKHANGENAEKNHYEIAFQLVYHYFYNTSAATPTFSNFAQAPLSIQLSYLRPPLRLILRSMLAKEAFANKNEHHIFSLLIGRNSYYISEQLGAALLSTIRELQAELLPPLA